MTKVTICDQNPSYREFLIKTLVGHYEDMITLDYCQENGELLTMSEKEGHITDIVIVDLPYEKEERIAAVKSLQQKKDVKVIFTTEYPEFVTDVFDVYPVDFMKKNEDPRRLLEAVDRAIQQIEEEGREFVLLMEKGCWERFRADRVTYIESEKRSLILHYEEEEFIVNMKLDELEKKFPAYFLRCHQSYLVNMREIKIFSADGIYLHCGKKIPVSRPRYTESRKRFLKFLDEE